MDFGHYLDRAVRMTEGLVNSHLADGTHVEIERPADLVRFIRGYGFSPGKLPTARDVRQVHRLRERLREVFEAPDAPTAAALLNAIIDESAERPLLVDHDRKGWHFHYVPDGAPESRRLAAEAAIALATVGTEHGFELLRVCEWETCRDVFVDRSPNRSRRFCSAGVCGNRASVAAWRARQKAARRK